MKTADVPKPGCCGPVKDRVKLIKQLAGQLVFAHNNVAILYETLAKDYLDDAKEYAELVDAAKRHKRLAEESSKVVIPDNLEDPT